MPTLFYKNILILYTMIPFAKRFLFLIGLFKKIFKLLNKGHSRCRPGPSDAAKIATAGKEWLLNWTLIVVTLSERWEN